MTNLSDAKSWTSTHLQLEKYESECGTSLLYSLDTFRWFCFCHLCDKSENRRFLQRGFAFSSVKPFFSYLFLSFPEFLHLFLMFPLIIMWLQRCLRCPRLTIAAHLGGNKRRSRNLFSLCRGSFRSACFFGGELDFFFFFFCNVSEKQSRCPIWQTSSLTTVKVPLSKVLHPPLRCSCCVVSSQDCGCHSQTPRWTCLCINDCNEQQHQRHRSQLQAAGQSCTNWKKKIKACD